MHLKNVQTKLRMEECAFNMRQVASRKLCSSEECTNYVINGGACVRHRAKRKKLCSAGGCNNRVISGGVCLRHEAKVKLCRNEGCTNYIIF
eukprot:scaffold11814_cov78-Skeletonema_dohrnii-CCMP3373.AAC.3